MPLKVDKLSTGSLSVNGTEINKNGGLPYKVYTALLTQSGGDDTSGENGGTAVGNYPELIIGRTYNITDNFQLESDFTNVGAPNNNVGTYFVATGTTPASWGTYALLQYNTGAPVVTVLENTIGNIWFNYLEVGRYEINLSNSIEIDKTFLYIGNGPTVNQLVYFEEVGIKTITFYGLLGSESKLMIYSSLDGYSSFADGKCNKTPIEIRVYN